MGGVLKKTKIITARDKKKSTRLMSNHTTATVSAAFATNDDEKNISSEVLKKNRNTIISNGLPEDSISPSIPNNNLFHIPPPKPQKMLRKIHQICGEILWAHAVQNIQISVPIMMIDTISLTPFKDKELKGMKVETIEKINKNQLIHNLTKIVNDIILSENDENDYVNVVIRNAGIVSSSLPLRGVYRNKKKENSSFYKQRKSGSWGCVKSDMKNPSATKSLDDEEMKENNDKINKSLNRDNDDISIPEMTLPDTEHYYESKPGVEWEGILPAWCFNTSNDTSNNSKSLISSTIAVKHTDDTDVLVADTSPSPITSNMDKTEPDDFESTSSSKSIIFNGDSNTEEVRNEKSNDQNELKEEVKQIEDEKTLLLPTIKKKRVLPKVKRKRGRPPKEKKIMDSDASAT